MKPPNWSKLMYREGDDRPWSQAADDARRAVAALEAAGIRVHHQSRLMHFAHDLTWFAQSTLGDKLGAPARVRRVGQAAYDLVALRLILTQFRSQLTSPSIFERLQWLVSDPVLPHEGASQSKGRDHQFELYIAALHKAGGAKVTLAEPDVIVRLSGCNVAIAAKCIKSFKKLLTRVHEASLQIEKSRLPGMIFLDIQRAANPQGESLSLDNHHETYRHVLRLWCDGFWNHWLKRMAPVINGEYVIGIQLCVHFPTDFGHAIPTTFQHFTSCPAPNSPPIRDGIYGLMAKTLKLGMPAITDLNTSSML